MAVPATLLLLGVVMSAFQVTTIQVSPPQATQPRDPVGKPNVGTGTISGKVVAADTGAPMHRAQVTLGGSSRPLMTYTDNEGRYAFRALPPATYTLTVTPGNHRAGFLAGGYGVTYLNVPGSPMMRPKPIELADGQQLDGVSVSLLRAGAIVGTVTDASGEPASRVQVGALFVRRGMEPAMVGSFTTDDLGQFRVFGLAPGDYVVLAQSRGGFGGQYDIQGEATGFAPTYAPGTSLLAEAMRVRVPRGGQAAADIRLIETRVYTIRGTVVSSTGEVMRTASVMVTRPDVSPMMSSYGAGIMPDGTFVIRNIPPGQYELVANYTPPRDGAVSGPQLLENVEMASARVDVGASDVDGVILVMQRGATVIGQIIFEDGQTEGRRVQVFTQPTERRSFSPSPAVEVKDTTFTMRNVFNRQLVIRGSVIGRGPDLAGQSWGLKAVLLNGRDITDEPRIFTSADSGKLQLVFTAHAPGIEGVVTDDAGKPVQEYTVLAFGDDPATWQPGSSMIRLTRPMKGGKFHLRGLREGRYRVVAVPSEFSVNPVMPDLQLLEHLSKFATPVVLNAGETRPLELRLTPFEQ
jgi:hypothetical protein